MAAPTGMSSGHGHTPGGSGTTNVATATPTANGKLAGLPLTVFTGD
jgi:hypothetical protein